MRATIAVAMLTLGLVACSGGSSGSGGGAPPAPPSLSSLSPTQGPPGTQVTITGSNFSTSDNRVFFGNNEAQPASQTTTEIVVDVPPGTPSGAQSVTVSTVNGTSNALSFDVSAPGSGPTLSNLNPTQGPAGTTVTVTGSGFDPGTLSATFNGVSASVSNATATSFDAQVPSGATSGAVVATDSSGSSNGLNFTVTSTTPSNQGASGSMALDYLRAVPFSSLLVEVDFVQGFAPDTNALNRLVLRLEERLNKPGGITLNLDDAIPPPGSSPWSIAEIQSLEATHRDTYASGNTAVLYVLYLDGNSENDGTNTRTLGISYSGSSFCVFKQAVRDTTTGPFTEVVIERAILVHEAGHNLGLVNNGIPMQTPHQDVANGRHDTDDDCAMHFSINNGLLAVLGGNVPDQFDALCIDDMQAAGGK